MYYYPAGFRHSLQHSGGSPANYLMFKWRNDLTSTDSPLGFGRFRFEDAGETPVQEDFRSAAVFQGPTDSLGKLHCHTTTLTHGGAGYEAHADPYDVAIIVLEGEVETLGRRQGRTA